jgi:catechol 2,3-dioxygenase-like lactoylglutathione lyase family enzyme
VARRQVTDFQKIVIFFAGVVAIFLAAMALGGRNPWWLLGSAAAFGGAVIGTIMVRARQSGSGRELMTAWVISASPPPANAAIAARCDMRLMVDLPGRGKVETRLRDPAVPLSHWPRRGRTFPVDVFGGNPHRRLHIRWDLVEQGILRAQDASESGSHDVIWENEEQPLIVSPTPPRRRSASPGGPPPAAGSPAVHVFEEFTDPDGRPLRTPPSGPRPRPPDSPATGGYAGHDQNGHDPYGFDLADFEEARLDAVTLPDFDPVNVDRSDFGETRNPASTGEVPATTPPAGQAAQSPHADDAQAAAPAAATSEEGKPAAPIPQPRLAEPAVRARPGSPARGGTGLAGSLPVADLARSLRFYQEQVGLTVAFTASDSAVVEGEGTSILLEHVGSPPGLAPRRAEIILHVTDIEATCATLQARGVRFVDLPAPVSTGGSGVSPESGASGEERTDVPGGQLWQARLRDPDGHEVIIVEWRERPGNP